MKLRVGILFGGFFGALGILFFLIAFGTDYWLLATQFGRCPENVNDTRVSNSMHFFPSEYHFAIIS